jgi:uncharacterized protein YjiS (DUF1127 family)
MLFKRIKTTGIPQTLLRYLAEVIIIFLGITISFLFEQWREEKRQQKELIELSESLLTDIEELKIKLNSDGGGSEYWISQLDSLRTQRTSGKISKGQATWLYYLLTNQIYFLFDPYSPTYMSAANSGLINELPDSLKNQLYDLYRIHMPFFQLLYDHQQKAITNFQNNVMAPSQSYLYQNDPSQVQIDLNTFAKEIQLPVYGNFINQVILTEKEVYKLNRQTFDLCTKAQSILREYIEQHKE